MFDPKEKIIAGVHPVSMIDYPGKVAMVVFFSGCNLRCPYCHNAALARADEPPQLSPADVLDMLNARQDDIDAVVLTGGEPLLQEGIFYLIQQLQRMGYSVKLDTNGTVRPFWRTLDIGSRLSDRTTVVPDYVAIDLKMLPGEIREHESSPKCYQNNLAALAILNKSEWHGCAHSISGEIRTTVHQAITPDLHLLKEAWRPYIDGLPWYLQQYRACEGFDSGLQYKPTYSDRELADIAVGVGAHIRGVDQDLVDYVERKLKEKEK